MSAVPKPLPSYGYPPMFMDAHEAARYLGYPTPSILYKLEKEGKLKAHRLSQNGEKRYKRTDLENLGEE